MQRRIISILVVLVFRRFFPLFGPVTFETLFLQCFFLLFSSLWFFWGLFFFFSFFNFCFVFFGFFFFLGCLGGPGRFPLLPFLFFGGSGRHQGAGWSRRGPGRLLSPTHIFFMGGLFVVEIWGGAALGPFALGYDGEFDQCRNFVYLS